MGKFTSDLLKERGKWSFKRVTALYVLNVSIIYAFSPLLFPKFEVMEFVMLSLIGYSASMMGITVWQKNVENRYNIVDEENYE